MSSAKRNVVLALVLSLYEKTSPELKSLYTKAASMLVFCMFLLRISLFFLHSPSKKSWLCSLPVGPSPP